MTGRKAELMHPSYIILGEMIDPLLATSSMHPANSKPENYFGVKLAELNSFLVEILPSDVELKIKESNPLKHTSPP